jgi:hypothetical protein
MFYLDLFSALHRHRVDYVLIGGLAVSLHGIERATMDIDLSIALTPANTAAMIGAAQELRLQPVLPVALESLADTDQLERWRNERNLLAFALRTPDIAGVTVDILLSPQVHYPDLSARAIELQVNQVPVRIASIPDLIALNQAAARPIDLADVEHLKKIQASNRS